MKARVTWIEDRSFVGRADSGHQVVLGTALGDGPRPGPSPMELVLIGTGGCAAWDVVNILAKGREAVEDVVVELEADRAETDPGLHPHPHALHAPRPRPRPPQGRARHRPLGREVLLRLGDARQDRHDHPRLRDRRHRGSAGRRRSPVNPLLAGLEHAVRAAALRGVADADFAPGVRGGAEPRRGPTSTRLPPIPAPELRQHHRSDGTGSARSNAWRRCSSTSRARTATTRSKRCSAT